MKSRIVHWVALVLIGLTVFIASSEVTRAASKRPVSFQDLTTGYPGSTLSLSPDGTLLAAENNDRLVLLAYPSGRLIQELGDGILPKWSPSGDTLAFYSTRSGVTQLWAWSRSGRVHQLTTFPQGIDPDFYTRFVGYITDAMPFAWSPDGRKIAFASRVAVPRGSGGADAPLVLTNTTDPGLTTVGVCALPTFCSVDVHIEGRQLVDRPLLRGVELVNQLFVTSIDSGRTTQITNPDRIFYGPIWTKDGASILAASLVTHGKVSDLWTAFGGSLGVPDDQIVKINPTTHTFTVVVDNAGGARQLALSQDGDTLYYITSANILAPAHLAMVDMTNGQAHATAWTGTLDFIRPLASGPLEVVYRNNGQDIFADLRGDEVTLSNSHQLNGVAPDALNEVRGGGIVWIDGLSNVQYLASTASTPTTIFRFHADQADLEFGKSATVTWKNHRGDTLTGSLLYPLDYVAGHRYPLIVDAYPLTHADGWMHSMESNQTWSAAGYMTFMPGERAPHVWMNASNKAFGAAGKGPNGWNVALDDVMSGVDELNRRGLIDPNRMCLYGHSNGGGAVSYLVTMTHRFKCAIVVAPALAQWITPAILVTGGREQTDQFSGGYDFNHDVDDFIKMSSVFQLYKARTPMLIADGDDDAGFLLDSIAVYDAVRDTGTPVTFIRYPGQGHVFTGAAMYDFWKRQMAFFAKYLKR